METYHILPGTSLFLLGCYEEAGNLTGVEKLSARTGKNRENPSIRTQKTVNEYVGSFVGLNCILGNLFRIFVDLWIRPAAASLVEMDFIREAR